MNEERLNGEPKMYPHDDERVNPNLEPMQIGPFNEEPEVMMEDNMVEDNMSAVEETVAEEVVAYHTRTIVIETMDYGYIVKLDCHKFAFESVDRALKYINEYLKDPQGTEEKWWKKELF